ncbi:MAG: SAM-dependent methyltransferase [Rhodoferax sp.]|nr:SAM-dependent methyltransferase [Rhodoferax sp.]
MHQANPGVAYFDALFTHSDDPWHFRTRWYEARKRAITLACLPARHYAAVFEPGCANGELSAALAPRCDRLLVSDGSAQAVPLARARLAAWPHAEVRQAWLPDGWPEENFDLIVLSEVLYYLTLQQLARLIDKVRATLRPGGTVLACHWRRPIAGCMLDGDAVHDLLHARLAMPRLSSLQEPDFRLDVWCLDARSVAQLEGLG